MDKQGKGGNDDESDYSSEEEGDNVEEFGEAKERNVDKVDLTKLVRAMPETLEGFSYTSKKNDVLEKHFTFKGLITGLIERGVFNFSFNKIFFNDSADDENIKLFRSIFTDKINNTKVKYLRFHECKNVEFLADAFQNLERLETISLTKCGISGMNSFPNHSPNFFSFYRSQHRESC